LSCLYNLEVGLGKTLSFLFTRLKVNGRENVPHRGAVIVVSNHLSLADPPLLFFCLGRRVAFMAKEELFHSRLSAILVRHFGAFPVSRRRLNREALKKADEVLAGGQALVIFPEGMRSKKAALKSAYTGAALVAIRSQALLLPVGITGTEVLRGLGWLWRHPRVTVNIGHSFYLPEIDGKMEREKLNEFTDLIMRHIAELLPREYQGVYSRAGRHDGTGD
jgi:1-acyl-sn-glycerol-3-phosphate acyltransferase